MVTASSTLAEELLCPSPDLLALLLSRRLLQLEAVRNNRNLEGEWMGIEGGTLFFEHMNPCTRALAKATEFPTLQHSHSTCYPLPCTPCVQGGQQCQTTLILDTKISDSGRNFT